MSNEKAKTVRYISKYGQLRIVLKPTYTSELHGRIVTHAGEDVRFEDGVFSTDKAEVVEALEKRSEFGSIFIRVPDDTDALAHREEKYKDIETKQKELEEKEKELAIREARLNNDETGRTVSGVVNVNDGLEALTRDALNELAEEQGIEEPEKYLNKKLLIQAIRESKEDLNKGEEGEGLGAY